MDGDDGAAVLGADSAAVAGRGVVPRRRPARRTVDGEDPLLKPQEVAERLGVARSTVFELIRTRALAPTVLLGARTRRVRTSVLERFIAARSR